MITPVSSEEWARRPEVNTGEADEKLNGGDSKQEGTKRRKRGENQEVEKCLLVKDFKWWRVHSEVNCMSRPASVLPPTPGPVAVAKQRLGIRVPLFGVPLSHLMGPQMLLG